MGDGASDKTSVDEERSGNIQRNSLWHILIWSLNLRLNCLLPTHHNGVIFPTLALKGWFAIWAIQCPYFWFIIILHVTMVAAPWGWVATWAMHDPAQEIIPLVMLFVNRGRTLVQMISLCCGFWSLGYQYIDLEICVFCEHKGESCQWQ